MRIRERHEVIAAIDVAFRDCPRPEEFVDASHCEECAEHNNTLLGQTREDIGMNELGNPGWDPLCFVRPEGFLYYFPAMVRLVFDKSIEDDYLGQFLFHCTYEGTKSRFFRHFNREQVGATADVMRFLYFNWRKKLEKHLLSEEADRAVEIWDSLERRFEERR